MTVELPPLRSYKHHLEVLAHVFPQQACERHGRRPAGIAPDAMAALHAYDFPGNMRELRNALEHAVILAGGRRVERAHLPRSIADSRDAPPPAPSPRTLAELREEWLAPLEGRYLRDLLAETRGSVRAAAVRAGVDAVTLYRLLRKRSIAHGRSAL